MLEHFEEGGSENPYAIQQDLQETMHTLVGIIRTEPELQEALARLQTLKERAERTRVEGNRQYNPGWHLAMDLHSMLAVSEAITLAAIERKESRGGHTRDDFPQTDAEWGKWNLAVRLGPEGEVHVAKEPLPEMPAELAELVKEPAKVGA
jgi:succinate dehydrogenase / fumarate reductase flavoprotein subunit